MTKFCKKCRTEFSDHYAVSYCSVQCHFYDNVDIPEDLQKCWFWTGAVVIGYGRSNFKGDQVGAHVRSYMLLKGPIPEGMLVRHKCPGGHSPLCVNPDHLELGSYKDNSDDKVENNTKLLGSNHPGAKLSEAQAIAIYADRRSLRTIAREYGISNVTVHAIKHGKLWGHITKHNA